MVAVNSPLAPLPSPPSVAETLRGYDPVSSDAGAMVGAATSVVAQVDLGAVVSKVFVIAEAPVYRLHFVALLVRVDG
jgi:hypothetical protein